VYCCCCCLPTAGQATGTAANMLALATVTPPYGVVYSPAGSHAASDECNAPESAMSGAKFIAVPSPDGKVDPASLDEMITNNREASEKYFHSLPTTISITNVTEAGTVYSAAETAAIGAVSKKHGLVLHLDGARFGNAVAAAGCSPAELTWKAGVDVMSFGCTKNGAMAAEAVVFFNRSLVGDFRYRYKRAGQLWCKMRYLSAQIEGYLANDCWIKNASHANGE
jgi:threonine aldolase